MYSRILNGKRVANCVKWHNYKLHELYDVMFDHTDFELINGGLAGAYADHLINKKEKCLYCPPESEVKEQIKSKNYKDLIQMYELCKKVWDYGKTHSNSL